MWNRAPGTLTLTVEDLPKFSLSVVRGTVTRQPASDTPIILTIAGGAETVFDTVDTNSGFQASLWRRALGASDTPHLGCAAAHGTPVRHYPILYSCLVTSGTASLW